MGGCVCILIPSVSHKRVSRRSKGEEMREERKRSRRRRGMKREDAGTRTECVPSVSSRRARRERHRARCRRHSSWICFGLTAARGAGGCLWSRRQCRPGERKMSREERAGGERSEEEGIRERKEKEEE